MRAGGREAHELRPVKILTGVQRDPHGSVQIAFGNTVVLIAATVADAVPEWMKEREGGWITAEYAMLPGATPGRVPRQKKGRAEEIQRLVGRSLRAAVDLKVLGKRTITVDCDVLQADGGTRTAAITGGFVAVELAVRRLVAEGKLAASPIKRPVCAVSCAVVDRKCLLDPDYAEDSQAEVDMNFVLSGDGRFIEIQGTAEREPFEEDLLQKMIALAWQGGSQLVDVQREALRQQPGT